jgi:hypothetical protein
VAALPPPQPHVIEPPPWADTEGDVSLAPIAAPDPGPPLDALSALKADEPYEPPPFSLDPPVVIEPLQRPVFPEPDWRAEEAERQAREGR